MEIIFSTRRSIRQLAFFSPLKNPHCLNTEDYSHMCVKRCVKRKGGGGGGSESYITSLINSCQGIRRTICSDKFIFYFIVYISTEWSWFIVKAVCRFIHARTLHIIIVKVRVWTTFHSVLLTACIWVCVWAGSSKSAQPYINDMCMCVKGCVLWPGARVSCLYGLLAFVAKQQILATTCHRLHN